RRVEGVRAAARLEAMRTDIARQMHDLVAYSMSHTALRAQHAAHNPNHTPQARTEFAAIASNATDALHELRLLLRTLRHTTPTTQDIATTTGLGGVVTNLPAAIQAIADDITAAGFTLTYRCLGNTTPTRLQATTMSRVAREMGANIIRHAAPNAPVTLTLTLNPNIIRLVTTNKTTTHKTTHLPTSGTGTTGMREHLAPLNGTLTILNENNSWITTATIPTNNQPTPPTTPKEAQKHPGTDGEEEHPTRLQTLNTQAASTAAGTADSAQAAHFSEVRPYVLLAFLVGIQNLGVSAVNLTYGPPVSLASWYLILGAMIVLMILPLRPLPASLAYVLCWTMLLLHPSTYASDYYFTNLLFVFLAARFLPTGQALLLGSTFLCWRLPYLLDTANWHREFTYLIATAVPIAVLMPLGMMLRSSDRARRVEGVRAAARLEAMRTDIARQMHDLVAYSMSHTALRAQHAAHNPNHTPQARTEFAAIASNATDALHELRLLLRTLRHTTPTTQDIATTTGLGGVVTNLPAAIQAIADDITAAGFTLTYRCLGNTTPTRLQATTMSRVAREMGANIIRHAAPNAPVTLTLTLNPNIIRLVTTNKTTTHKTTHLPTSGTGTTGMREHLAPLNGTLTILNENNSWITTATIPTNNQPTPPTTPKEAR
ncbi:histidine kinase, partial [Actinomyces trachealis]|uniref:sensor histidine kinase n=1 Tax=Actinomyces trachealis TaxID=2763540 RepID=UPI001892B30B